MDVFYEPNPTRSSYNPSSIYKTIATLESVGYLAVLAFAFGLITFSCGFLLNRSELTHITRPISNRSHTPQYTRLLFILVDALAFDFVQQETSTYGSNVRGNMHFTSKLIKTNMAHILHFTADPPTTTLQRLKGLMTGSMPTFIDVGSNFGSSELFEDNLINQWKLAGKRILFVGDDTWTGLFPSSFTQAYPHPSFDVKDLDTVDRAVTTTINSVLSNTSTDQHWDIVIGHMLGIDHCGHTYGPQHPEMRRKLRELDIFISNVVEHMNPTDLLVVVGDHGMTSSGDHGGDSSAELDAALLLYNQNGFYSDPNDRPSKIRQIDLVPTLAILTGVPIPFSNLGVYARGLFQAYADDRTRLVKNFVQVLNYTVTYIRKIGLFPLGDDLKSLVDAAQSDSDKHVLELARQLSTDNIEVLLKQLQDVFRTHWTRFDYHRMVLGICTMSFGIFFIFIDNSEQLNNYCILVFLILFNLTDVLFSFSTLIMKLSTLSIMIVLFFVILLKFIRSWDIRFTLSPILLIILLSSSHFSNSFLVQEALISVFLIQTLLFFLLFQILRKLAKSRHSIAMISPLVFLIFLFRINSFFEICREESSPGSSCRPILDCWLAKPLSKLTENEVYTTGMFRIVVSGSVLFALSFANVQYLQNRLFVDPSNCIKLVSKLPPFAISFMLVICYLLDAFSKSTASTLRMQLVNTRVCIAVGILIISFIYIVTVIRYSLSDSTSHSKYAKKSCSASHFNWISTTMIMMPFFIIMVFLSEIFTVTLIFIPVALVLFSIYYPDSNRATDATSIKTLDRLQHLNSWHMAVFACLLDNLSFYTTGHQPTISGIPWEAAFAAYAGNHGTYILPAAMVCCHLFSGPILTALSLPIVFCVSSITQLHHKWQITDLLQVDLGADQAVQIMFVRNLDRLLWRFFSLKVILTYSCVLSVAILRRHLMVWKIFAPRFLFSVASLVVSSIFLLLARFLVVNVLHRSVCSREKRTS